MFKAVGLTLIQKGSNHECFKIDSNHECINVDRQLWSILMETFMHIVIRISILERYNENNIKLKNKIKNQPFWIYRWMNQYFHFFIGNSNNTYTEIHSLTIYYLVYPLLLTKHAIASRYGNLQPCSLSSRIKSKHSNEYCFTHWETLNIPKEFY